MTAEQRAAFARLLTLAAPLPLRVRADAEGFPVVSGRLGQVELASVRELAVYTDRPRIFGQLRAVAGIRRHQTGDREMRALFPPEGLAQVARVIKARRRRKVSPEEARRRGFKATHRNNIRGSGIAPRSQPWPGLCFR